MSKKYNIITYGCQMNVHESEKLSGILISKGYEETSDFKDADIIVLNTCCIRETAETHVLGNLGQIKTLRETRPNIKVAVCGCMPQKEGTAQMLKKRCPFINIIFGTHNIHKFGDYLDSLNKQKSVIDIWDSARELCEDVPIHRTSGYNAWVNIMYGCDNFCSYCIVPYVRGRERSRDENAILSSVKELVKDGYKEITLLGQNVNSYGNDLKNKDINFTNLLNKIGALDGDFWLRFLTSHPKDLSEDVVKVMATSNKIAKHIHLPIQSGSNRILKLMNRKYTVEQYLEKLEMIRSYIPDVGITSDIMVGFPSETEEDFLSTLSLVKKAKFTNLYTFVYSRRSGTVADKMDEQISAQVKQDRIKRLISTQAEVGKTISQAEIGNTYKVLCEKFSNSKISGKTSSDRFVSFIGAKELCGSFVNIKITKNKNNKLEGEII